MSVRTWGFSPDEWESARGRLTNLLSEVAAARSTVTYGEVAQRVFDGRVSARSGALMDLLSDVDLTTERARGIMIAALVVRADSGIPGEGYFTFAQEELGRTITNRWEFWRGEVERVWDSFATEEAALR